MDKEEGGCHYSNNEGLLYAKHIGKTKLNVIIVASSFFFDKSIDTCQSFFFVG